MKFKVLQCGKDDRFFPNLWPCSGHVLSWRRICTAVDNKALLVWDGPPKLGTSQRISCLRHVSGHVGHLKVFLLSLTPRYHSGFRISRWGPLSLKLGTMPVYLWSVWPWPSLACDSSTHWSRISSAVSDDQYPVLHIGP